LPFFIHLCFAASYFLRSTAEPENGIKDQMPAPNRVRHARGRMQVTELLRGWSGSDPLARVDLMPLVYGQRRRLAFSCLHQITLVMLGCLVSTKVLAQQGASEVKLREQPAVTATHYYHQPEVYELKKKTVVLPATVYARPELAEAHQRSVDQLNKAVLQIRKTPDLSAKQVALVNFQTKEALRLAAVDTTAAPATYDSQRQNQLDSVVAPLNQLSETIQSTGSARTAKRQVRVTVIGKSPNVVLKPLRVYVLPKAIAMHPESYDNDTVKSLVATLVFDRPTTPSIGELPLADFALWLTPEFNDDRFIQRLRSGSLNGRAKWVVVALDSPDPIDKTFLYPDEVFLPPEQPNDESKGPQERAPKRKHGSAASDK
jgi:hypothetical protein